MAAQLHGNSNTCEQSYVFDGCIKRMQAYNTWREYSPSTPALGKKKKNTQKHKRNTFVPTSTQTNVLLSLRESEAN